MATPPVSETIEAPGPAPSAARTLFPILAAVSVCHMLNDMVQSLLPSIYPILKSTFKLDFSQIGLLSLTYQVVASLLQPFIGMFTDRRPVPFALAFGMCFTLAGIVLLAIVPTFGLLLVAAAVVASGPGPAHARSDAMSDAAVPQSFDQTVYRPTCPQVEYDQHCLFDGCASGCGRR